MLISAPFLNTHPAGYYQDVNTIINSSAEMDASMRESAQGGSYPVGNNLAWHGGVHYQAPQIVYEHGFARALPVRAIADGTVILRKEPQAEELGNPNHTLAYDGGWTNNGAVIIRHQADIGVAADGTVVTVTFFSVYQHLREIDVQQGAAVSRKSQIGSAGFISGVANQIHLEIVCNDENLRRLIGRASGDLDTTQNGRTDVLFGEMYVKLPAGSPIYTVPNNRRLLHNRMVAHLKPTNNNQAATPLASSGTTDEDYYIGLNYAMGEGAIAQRGNLTITTYREDGTVVGTQIIQNAEYNIYKSVEDVCNDWSEETRPGMYFVHDLLRFCRVISTEDGASTLADVPHWRMIALPNNSVGWVNLNIQNGEHRTTVFSDADFPQWRGWKLIDDDTSPNDNRCDSPNIRGLFDENSDDEINPEEMRTGLNRHRQKLQYMICSMPSEWDAATIEARWSWLRTPNELNNQEGLSDDDFTGFSSFVRAICLEAPTEYFSARWHFHPRAFIETFRKCGWLTDHQLSRIYPQATAQRRQTYLIPINKCCRKYFITGLRAGNFFGQAGVESGQLSTMQERFNNPPGEFAFFRNYEKAKNYAGPAGNSSGWLGNILWNDGGNFRGRGLKQMTGRSNYASYWLYRGWILRSTYTDNWWRNTGWWGIQGNYIHAQHRNLDPLNPAQAQNAATINQLTTLMRPPVIDDFQRLVTEPVSCVDSAGWFWAKNSLVNNGRSLLYWADQNHHIWVSRIIRGDSVAATPTEQAYANIPDAHFAQRRDHSNRIRSFLGDEP